MNIKRICLLLALSLALAVPAAAAEVESGSVYCFTQEDFSTETLAGICITELPENGTVMLGSRILRPGDILTAEQVEQMTFSPVRTGEDTQAVISYLPIFDTRVAPCAAMTIAIRGRQDQAPVAEDFTLETYKNLPNEGVLKASDPEGEGLTFTVIRQPRRGELTVNADGSFTYTPKKNKVGVDSFTYTAADPAGNVSREATVTVTILKPTEAAQYTDTVGMDCRFEAEWLRNTGLFVGENVSGQACFQPDKAVSQGEFLAMVMELLEMDTHSQSLYTGLAADAPQWLKPYLAAAVRSGLMTGLTEEFASDASVTAETAAQLLQNALDLPAQTVADGEQTAISVMNENGLTLTAGQILTRAQAAQLLYQVSKVAPDSPGMAVLRKQ